MKTSCSRLSCAVLRRPASSAALLTSAIAAAPRDSTAAPYFGNASPLASFSLLALGGAFTWRHVEEQRKGEAARDQVLTALRITNHALNEVQARLAARNGNE